MKTPSLDHDGVMLFDLQAQSRNGLNLSSHRLRLRLSVAGTALGGSVEYQWIRFIRRASAERLRANPGVSTLIVAP